MTPTKSRAIYEPSFFRGLIGDGINPRVVTDFGCALGTLLPPGAVVVGRDGRLTGEHYARSIISALNSTGRDVYALGIAPSATLSVAARELRCAGAVSITPGALDAPWSGLKFYDANGEFLAPRLYQRILRVYESKKFTEVPSSRIGLFRMDYTCLTRHIQRITEMSGIELMDINRAQMSVVVDCANSGGGSVFPQFLRCIGVTVHELNSRPAAKYAHPPTLAPANFSELRSEIKNRKAHAGIGLDADASHIVLFDERGQYVPIEKMLMMIARQCMRTRRGPIGVEKGLMPRLRKFISGTLEAPVWDIPHTESEALLALRRKKGHVGLSAEGGVLYLPENVTPDSLVTTALALSDLAISRQTLSELVNDLENLTN